VIVEFVCINYNTRNPPLKVGCKEKDNYLFREAQDSSLNRLYHSPNIQCNSSSYLVSCLK